MRCRVHAIRGLVFALLGALLSTPIGNFQCRADEQDRPRAPLPELRSVDRQALPTFEIDGRPARVHTQGLFVTDRYYYVTGRLQRSQKRPLLVRFDRAHPSVVESVDLRVASGAMTAGDATLDHPGGFDFDGESFWIPLAISRPHSRSLIVRVHPQPGKPLSAVKAHLAFRVDDHIGAIAYDAASARLYGANWDTKQIYAWKRNGTLVEQFAQTELSPRTVRRALAVQDWKGLGNGSVLAGANDQSVTRRSVESKAVLQLIDLEHKRELGQIRLTCPSDRSVALTNEGMAVFKDCVFLLPSDLGTNAEVFRYRWSKPFPGAQ